MKHEEICYLLDRIEVIRLPCDLDLLLFFVRHPRALLTSEQIAAFLGYGLKDIAESLDALLAAGFLSRTQNPSHSAPMYIFLVNETTDGWLPPLLRLASMRAGRLGLRKALAHLLAPEEPGSYRANSPTSYR